MSSATVERFYKEATMTATMTPTMPETMTATATATIELHAFMWIADVFKERHWANPLQLEIDEEMTGPGLLIQLAIPTDQVAMIFVNHRAYVPRTAIIKPGDRVALVPPGAPVPFTAVPF
jgi:sulfur carrier protein ThiS